MVYVEVYPSSIILFCAEKCFVEDLGLWSKITNGTAKFVSYLFHCLKYILWRMLTICDGGTTSYYLHKDILR